MRIRDLLETMKEGGQESCLIHHSCGWLQSLFMKEMRQGLEEVVLEKYSTGHQQGSMEIFQLGPCWLPDNPRGPNPWRSKGMKGRAWVRKLMCEDARISQAETAQPLRPFLLKWEMEHHCRG